jgi:hypothetical protein
MSQIMAFVFHLEQSELIVNRHSSLKNKPGECVKILSKSAIKRNARTNEPHEVSQPFLRILKTSSSVRSYQFS